MSAEKKKPLKAKKIKKSIKELESKITKLESRKKKLNEKVEKLEAKKSKELEKASGKKGIDKQPDKEEKTAPVTKNEKTLSRKGKPDAPKELKKSKVKSKKETQGKKATKKKTEK